MNKTHTEIAIVMFIAFVLVMAANVISNYLTGDFTFVIKRIDCPL